MLLYNIDEQTMIEIISKSIINLYNSNDIIYYQNSQPIKMFLILNGEVCFKKYSNLDLLAMIGGEDNIVISKRFRQINNTKMTKSNLLFLRYNAFIKGKEDINNKNILTCGDFFGEENLLSNNIYVNCAIAKKDSIILSINIDIFNYYLKKRIIKTQENIKELLLRRFTFFNKSENKQVNMYIEKISKIFPKNGEIIYKENELSDKLYLIYQGKCAVTKISNNLGNILFLNKGDVFGYESLKCLSKCDENQKIQLLKYEYTIVNKDDSTIILILNIPFFDELTTWKIYHNLIKYIKIQKNIITKFEKCKLISTELLQEKYKNLDIRKIYNKSSYKLTNNRNRNRNANLNKEYRKIFNRTIASDNEKIKNIKINKRKVNLFFQYFKKFQKNYLKSLFRIKEKNEKIKKLPKSFDNIKIISNNTTDETDAFTTPKKIKKNKNNILTNANIKIEKNLCERKNSNSVLSMYCMNNNKSNTFRKTSTHSMISMSTFGDSKTLNKCKFILKNRTKTKNNKSNKKTKIEKCQMTYNKIYYRNNNKICSNFDYKKIGTNVECLPFIFSDNQNILLSPIQNNNTSRINMNGYFRVNKYNYPSNLDEKTDKNNP